MREIKINQTKLDRIQSISSFFKDINIVNKKKLDDNLLIEKAKSGDQKAISDLIKIHSKFVVAVARQYSKNPHTVADLIQVGQIGLLESIKNFDPTRGFKFISYAVWHIRKEIIHFLKMELKTVKLSTWAQDTLRRIKKEEELLTNILERTPSAYEISKSLEEHGISIDSSQIDLLLVADYEESLDVNLESGISKVDLISSNLEFGAFLNDEKDELLLWIKKLPPLERKIIERCSGISGNTQLDLAEFARGENKSREWARLLWNRAIFKLRQISMRKN
jgi:RNA polymerase primary sigma factor